MEAVIIEQTDRTDGVIVINGRQYIPDAKGSLVPLEMVKPQHKLEDETVRKIMAFALDLNQQIARFRDHTMVDLGTFDALLARNTGRRSAARRATAPIRPSTV